MPQSAPGKAYRKGITLVQVTRMFPNDAAAEKWFEKTRWGKHGPHCPHCGSTRYAEKSNRRPQPYRCKDCRMHFSVKTGSLMEGSKLGMQAWAIAIYLMTTGLKGQASMKLHRDLGITQKSAWFLAHRIRENFLDQRGPGTGPVEVDETYIGGKRKNMSNSKRRELAGTGRGGVGKAIVVGAKDRDTNRVSVKPVQEADQKTLHQFIGDRVEPGTQVYTDDAKAYQGMPFPHATVTHSKSEYVKGDVHTNGIESFWSMMKRGYVGTYHHMSEKHLDRYAGEFAGRHNNREKGTPEQMEDIVRGMVGKRMRYLDLISD